MKTTRVLFTSGTANLGGLQSSTHARIQGLKACGVVAHKLFTKPGVGIATYSDVPTYIAGHPRELDAIVRAGRFDAVSMINRTDVLPSLRRIGFRGRVLLEVRGRSKKALKACKSLTPRDVGGIVVISNYVRRLVVEALRFKGIPIHVVYNAVDTSMFQPLQHVNDAAVVYARDASERPVVLWVGRLSANKNYEEMLRIARLLASGERPPVFWVVSDTNAKDNTDDFWRIVQQYGLENDVRLLPCVPHTAMVHVYNLVARSGGCVLSTSKSEGFQNSLLEAMACGVPVVCSAVTGNVELVEDGVNGRLYPLGYPAKAAQCINELLNHDRMRRSYVGAGLARVRSHHTPRRHVLNFTKVLADTPVMKYAPEKVLRATARSRDVSGANNGRQRAAGKKRRKEARRGVRTKRG